MGGVCWGRWWWGGVVVGGGRVVCVSVCRNEGPLVAVRKKVRKRAGVSGWKDKMDMASVCTRRNG